MSARAARPARPTRAFFILTYLFDVSFETTRRNDPANFLWMTRSKIYHFFLIRSCQLNAWLSFHIQND